MKKKLLLLLLVFLGGVGSVSAQITESGKLKVYVYNDGSWANIYVYAWNGKATPKAFPGTKITDTETIGNTTFYVASFDRSTFIDATHTTFNFIISIGSNSNQSGTISCSGDRFVNTSNKAVIPAYYLITTSGTDATLLSVYNIESLTKTFGPFESNTNYAIANSYGFSYDGKINWSNTNNIIRPSSDTDVAFENVEDVTVYRGQSEGSWVFPAGEAKYDFSFSLASEYAEGSNSYSITPYFTRTISSAGISTFSSQYAVAIPSGITASYITGVGDNNVLTSTSFSKGIPASTGALLVGTAGTYNFTPATSTDAVSGNKLVAVTSEPASISQTESEGTLTNYILTNKTVNSTAAPARFYKVNSGGNTVGAGKAYLQLPTGTVGAREYFSIWDEDVTGIQAVRNTELNGQAYNLNGQRVSQPSKGLYIVNGKKVILK